MTAMPIEIPSDADYLPPGVHHGSVAEVEAALVDAFAESKTRRPIYEEWLQLRDRVGGLVTLGIQWINGSFATRKRDPGDIDVATFMQSAEVDSLSPESQDELNGLMASKDTTGRSRLDCRRNVIQGHYASRTRRHHRLDRVLRARLGRVERRAVNAEPATNRRFAGNFHKDHYRAEIMEPSASRGPLRILVAIASPEVQNEAGELLNYEAELARIVAAVDPSRP